MGSTFEEISRRCLRPVSRRDLRDWKRHLRYATQHHPQAPRALRVAFASGVMYLVRGVSFAPPGEPCPGPTLREHLVTYALSRPDGRVVVEYIDGYGLLPAVVLATGVPDFGQWQEPDAYRHCEQIVFGPLEPYRDLCEMLWLSLFCYDDPDEDRELLESWTGLPNRAGLEPAEPWTGPPVGYTGFRLGKLNGSEGG